MNNSTKKTIAFVAILVLVVIGLFTLGKSGNPPPNQSATISQIPIDGSAPDFNLKSLSGETYSLSQYKDQNPVLLEFFAVWCPHCQIQAKVTKQVADSNFEAGLVTIGINSSPFGRFYTTGSNASVTENDIKWFLEQFDAHEPLLVDNGSVGQLYDLQGFPMLVLVNKEGKIAWSQSGEVSASALQAEIDKVLQ